MKLRRNYLQGSSDHNTGLNSWGENTMTNEITNIANDLYTLMNFEDL